MSTNYNFDYKNSLIKHLEFASNYKEERIRKMNQDSSILIGIEVALFSVSKLILDEPDVNIYPQNFLLIIHFILSMGTVFFFSLSIRPTFGKFIFKNNNNNNNKYNLIWTKKAILNDNINQYYKEWNSEVFISELQKSNIIQQKLINKKMRFYRFSTILLRLHLVFILIALFVYFLYK